MIEAALMLAALLHRDPSLVACVYEMGGLDAVVVVEYESQFNPRAWRRETEGTSWGLFQLYSKCHKQYRDDLLLHIVAGVEFLKECEIRAEGQEACTWASRMDPDGTNTDASPTAHSLAIAYSIYNSGSPWKSIAKGRAVERKRDSLALYLWRRLR